MKLQTSIFFQDQITNSISLTSDAVYAVGKISQVLVFRTKITSENPDFESRLFIWGATPDLFQSIIMASRTIRAHARILRILNTRFFDERMKEYQDSLIVSSFQDIISRAHDKNPDSNISEAKP